MTPRDRDYKALRAALEELRVADEREAPSFDVIFARRPRSWSFARSLPRRLVIAAGLVLAAGLAYHLAVRRERLMIPNEALALSAWRPASDALLETPVSSLLRHAPELGASLLNTSSTGDFR